VRRLDVALWNPEQYLKFGSDRLRPALDLIGQIALDHPSTIIDLGCGPGNVTDFLMKRWPNADVKGLDHSADMLEQARQSYDYISWVKGDVTTWVAKPPFDLIFSNACLHWFGGHDLLFPHILDQLNSGGVLAVQMPNNFAAPTHQLIRDCLDDMGRGDLAPNFPVHAPEFYYDLLSQKCSSLNIWGTEYIHILEGENPVYEWMSGAALRPVLDALASSPDLGDFLKDYGARIQRAYPRRGDGKTVMAFKRFFLVAQKI
jgi:trans-aconitate 2-methyltransferase